MSLFKKREEIPTIPPAPSLPRMDNNFQKKESYGLPNLPGSANDITNRAEIKSAIEDSSERKGGLDVGTIRSPPSNFQESNSLPKVEPIHHENDTPKIEETINTVDTPKETIVRSNEDSIFVKFDKYHSAKEDMTEIQSYLKSIEILVNELNKSKKEENDELEELEQEINKVKEKFNEVDSKVFNKL